MGEHAPHSAVFAGGIYHDFKDGRTAPDTCNALFEYDGFTVFFQSNAYEGEAGITSILAEGHIHRLCNLLRLSFAP